MNELKDFGDIRNNFRIIGFISFPIFHQRERESKRESESEREKRGGERWKKEKTNKYCEIPRKSIKCLSYQFFQSDKNIARHIISGEIFQSKSLLQNLGCF